MELTEYEAERQVWSFVARDIHFENRSNRNSDALTIFVPKMLFAEPR